MVATVMAMVAALAVPGEMELVEAMPQVFARSAEHYRALDAYATAHRNDKEGTVMFPRTFDRKAGGVVMRQITEWTNGHYPGALWYLYEGTGEKFFKDRAIEWTEALEPDKDYTGNHDIGFIMFCSFGNARRILNTGRYDQILLKSADTLTKRYNADLGLIRSWGKLDEKKDFKVIPDNLMNLELLMNAYCIGGEECRRFCDIAVSHADVTMQHHFRPDGGCFHVLDYDQNTKRVKSVYRGQGASCETAWSRGESWAIYGYVMMYRMTGFDRYLKFARKLADWAIANPNMPEDGIPYWDYGAPGEERDSSAGAIMASALIELSTMLMPEAGAKYRAFAVKQLTTLASDAFFSKGDEIGHFLLKHGVGARPNNSEVDQPLNYGDYYFLEGLLRLRALAARDAKLGETVAKLPAKAELPADELDFRCRAKQGKVREVAELALKDPIPDTTDALYREYSTNGNRTHYQKPFFQRLANLTAMVRLERDNREGRYLKRIEEYLTAICDMKSWVLPAHDGDLEVFDRLRTHVDLFSSEVSAVLACTVKALEGRLDPALVERIRREAEWRTFEPLRREIPYHVNQGCNPRTRVIRLHWWITTRNNWNAVCWDNVACAALGLLEDPIDRAYFVDAAMKSVPNYIDGFEKDGYCSEGMGYWNYGFGHHLTMGRMLRKVSGGKIDAFAVNAERQRLAAAYPRAYTLCKGVSPAFADGNGAVSGKFLSLADEVWPDLPKEVQPMSEFPEGQVWLLRDESGFCVAFKGGYNSEFHNHNDIGSYYLTVGGSFASGDPGGEEYTRRTFGAHRYESKVLSSYAHPVPVVGGKLQGVGAKYRAKVVSKEFGEKGGRVVLDLTGAYECPTLKSLARTFDYDRTAKTFTVTDKVSFASPTEFEDVYTTFVEECNRKYRKDVVGGGRVVWNCRPTVSVRGAEYRLSEEQVDNPDRLSPLRVGVKLANPVTEAEVKMVFSGLQH